MDVFDKVIFIQKINESTEMWEDVFTLHAAINKTRSDEYLKAGAVRSKNTKVFKVKYFKDLQAIELNTQFYRIRFNNALYNVVDYDDYKLQHKIIKLIGQAQT